jgi:anti-sigma regulatory factor (Ser/Thr protein kinase)
MHSERPQGVLKVDGCDGRSRGEGTVTDIRSAEMIMSTDVRQRGFVHSALLYHSEREYLDFVTRFVVDGLALDEPVLVAIPGNKLPSMRDVLWLACEDGLPAHLQLVDITEIARNPGRLLAIEGSFSAAHPGRRVRIVSQLAWPGRTADELLACAQHEALVNGAFEGHDAVALCLFDANQLDEDVLADARCTHPMLWKCGSAYRSAEYAPDRALARCNKPLPTSPGAVTYTVRQKADLRPARSFAVDYADWVGLSRDGIEELQLIATELASNSLMYTDGGCQLAFWRQEQHLVCEARDTGRFVDPLAGRRPLGASGNASRGLFMVNAMADLVRTHTTGTGTTIQAYLRLHPSRGQKG